MAKVKVNEPRLFSKLLSCIIFLTLCWGFFRVHLASVAAPNSLILSKVSKVNKSEVEGSRKYSL